ncbi:hypothetical protein ACYRFS_10620 [Listeria kieliensis]|uniref:Uncharacterized protein n=1 Tax=Listeria kieliensis TaxID=1621700 RepID=A0A3D8TNZ7_9LIST|nr:hypothetical protein [Listeria kieliensis]RDX00580.1 hypothetical protein UR08_06165 [Listeria kieliensis]
MKKYMINACQVILFSIYGFFLGYVMLGLPVTHSNLSDTLPSLIGGLAGSSFVLLVGFSSIKKRLNQNEDDERYVQNRSKFSFYFLTALLAIAPILLFLINLNGHFIINTRNIAQFIFILLMIYALGLYILKKK